MPLLCNFPSWWTLSQHSYHHSKCSTSSLSLCVCDSFNSDTEDPGIIISEIGLPQWLLEHAHKISQQSQLLEKLSSLLALTTTHILVSISKGMYSVSVCVCVQLPYALGEQLFSPQHTLLIARGVTSLMSSTQCPPALDKVYLPVCVCVWCIICHVCS